MATFRSKYDARYMALAGAIMALAAYFARRFRQAHGMSARSYRQAFR